MCIADLAHKVIGVGPKGRLQFRGGRHTLDKLSRITEKTETVGGQTHRYQYFYDYRGQLVDVETDGLPTAHYEYDSNGNRLSRVTLTVTGTYDAQDRMTQYGATTYQYTPNGELQSRTNRDGTTSYAYTALGTLRAVGLTDGTQIEYVLDGQERRAGKKVNGILVQGFLYENAIKPVAELDGNGQIVARFIYAGGNTPDYIVKNGQAYQIVSDHLGSPRLVVDVNTGTVVQKMDYDEYGRILLDTNPGFQPFGFAGGIYDRDTGLVQFGLREYDPETGRWTTKDPVEFEGGDTNLYRYVGNDPVNDLDSTGLSIGQPGDLEGALPVWGSTRAAIDNFQNGQWGWGLFNAVMAATDVFLVKAAVNIAVKGVVKGAARKSAEKAVEKGGLGKAGGLCFAEDTQIFTKDGTRSIQDIQVGDEVYSANPETNSLALRHVATTFQRTTDTLIDLTVRDSQGNEFVISGTPDHPFFVPALNQYLELGKLKEGTTLRTDSNRAVTVVAGRIRYGEFTVYNFEVESTHNYFVASPSGPWVLVHNGGACGRDPIKKAGRKKQGREVNEKKRQGKNWTSRNPPKPMKKHTPNSDHRRDKQK